MNRDSTAFWRLMRSYLFVSASARNDDTLLEMHLSYLFRRHHAVLGDQGQELLLGEIEWWMPRQHSMFVYGTEIR